MSVGLQVGWMLVGRPVKIAPIFLRLYVNEVHILSSVGFTLNRNFIIRKRITKEYMSVFADVLNTKVFLQKKTIL